MSFLECLIALIVCIRGCQCALIQLCFIIYTFNLFNSFLDMQSVLIKLMKYFSKVGTLLKSNIEQNNRDRTNARTSCPWSRREWSWGASTLLKQIKRKQTNKKKSFEARNRTPKPKSCFDLRSMEGFQKAIRSGITNTTQPSATNLPSSSYNTGTSSYSASPSDPSAVLFIRPPR